MEINWNDVFEKYEQLDNGAKALIKRATTLDEIKLSTILFQLGLEFNTQSCRVALFLPFIKSFEDGHSLGKAVAILDNGDIGKKDKYTTIGKRLMRIIRIDADDDLYEFRRLLRFVANKSQTKKINVDMESSCKSLYYWGKKSKKQIFENYLINKYDPKEK